MALTLRFEDALLFATQLHAKQWRKGTSIPYVAHLLAVTSLVLENGGEEDQAIAALLHDAIEDCKVTKPLIAEMFGDDVASLVGEVIVHGDDQRFAADQALEAQNTSVRPDACPGRPRLKHHDPPDQRAEQPGEEQRERDGGYGRFPSRVNCRRYCRPRRSPRPWRRA